MRKMRAIVRIKKMRKMSSQLNLLKKHKQSPRGVLEKNMLQKILQNSQENTFLNKAADLKRNFQEHRFL